MTLLEAAGALRSRQVSSLELTEAALAAIERGKRLNAFLTLTAETALRRARQADAERARGLDLGPLHGIPIAVKDLFETKGVPTTAGSKLFANHIPDRDAAVVERLAAAGAVLLGKTHMHELAYGITSNNPHFGPVRNPWDPDRIPGGSSGGSGAAVAAGMCFMAMGSDTGGSIRIPASYCGTVGLKPTTGLVSRYGTLPLGFTLDHMGPLTRTVRDTAVTMNVIAGRDDRDETSARRPAPDYLPAEHISLAGVRAGLPENYYFERTAPEAAAAVRRMAGLAESLLVDRLDVRVPDIEAINQVGRVILLCEASAVLEPYLESRRGEIGADVLALLDQGRLLPATWYVNAQRLRRVYRREFARLWESCDVLFTPTTPIAAPRIGESSVEMGGESLDTRLLTTRFVRAINVLGIPALSLPAGQTREGLPLGLQILGPEFSEVRVLAIGSALEDARGPFPIPTINA
ncbi:MAG TPA: Asp-tRNA(Asn)/Glu-tRNA(Gln) amidotransferase GatCAB subunit A [Solibacterales bacterium]|nr:Asp-tRNA(Asn)/Glu-tRNA(Gln) amidotransferase GatCAB subunit A [Bryobacterales bacterium]